MRKNTTKKPMITIAISTRGTNPTLVKTIKGIYETTSIPFRFIVVMDHSPYHKSIAKQLRSMGVYLVRNHGKGSLSAKLRQIIKLTNTQVLIFTQDDVFFDKNTVAEIVKYFKNNKKVSMASIQVKHLRARNIFETIIQSGARVAYRVSTDWKRGNNYLVVNGRCMVFRTRIAKKYFIPNNIVNLDAYLFFENRRIRGKFAHIKKSVVYMHTPSRFREHMRQSGRFTHSYDEISHFIKVSKKMDYSVPRKLQLKALFEEFVHNPFPTMLYLSIYVYSRINKLNVNLSLNPHWQIDTSTKH